MARHTLHGIINELVDRTNTDTRRIRSIESWEKSLNSRLEAIENNVTQRIITEMEDGLARRDKAITEMHNMIKEIVKHLKRFAKSEKIAELETMMEIYDPLKSNFVTKDEVEQLINKRLSSRGNNK
jgi:hypothetical protein